MTRLRRSAPALAVLTALWAASAAFGAPIQVETTITGGTRTLTVSAIDGVALQVIQLGSRGESAFAVNVTDVRYSRTGYQVTATMSDLYKFNAATQSFDCTKRLPSSAISLGFLTSPTSLGGVKALAQPLWNLTGTLTGTLATVLGVAPGTVATVSGVQGTDVEGALSGVFQGLEDQLPVKVQAGTGGPFTVPAPHPACAPSPPGTPTTLSLMSGQASTTPALLTQAQDAIRQVVDQNHDGTISASELASSGAVPEANLAEAVRTALLQAGVAQPTLDVAITTGQITYAQLFTLFSATMQNLSGLVGQSGSYTALPKLTANLQAADGPGTFRGEMTVTIADRP